MVFCFAGFSLSVHLTALKSNWVVEKVVELNRRAFAGKSACLGSGIDNTVPGCACVLCLGLVHDLSQDQTNRRSNWGKYHSPAHERPGVLRPDGQNGQCKATGKPQQKKQKEINGQPIGKAQPF